MKFIKHRPFKSKVLVTFPAAEADGADDVQEFIGHFVALPMDEISALPLSTREEQETYLQKVFVGWSGLTDDRDGKDVPLEFSEENRDLLIRDFFVRRAVMQTYAAALAGAKRGN